MTDVEMLRAFVEQGDEGAFGEVVRGHLGAVYAAALRRVGDPGMAEDVTQAVFIVLAKKAKGIRDGRVLAGWLMEVTRHCAADARKMAGRRRVHERVAAGMKEAVVNVAMGVEMDVMGMVDEGLEGLGEMDRTAVVLRCLEERPLEEVGRMMGLSEEAAKKRVERAVEKMRKIFAGKGVVLSAGVIASVMAKQLNAAPVPVGLAEKVLVGAMAKGVATSTAAVIAKGVVKAMAWTMAKMVGVAAVGVLVAGLGATAVVVMMAGAKEVAAATKPATKFVDVAALMTQPATQDAEKNAYLEGDVAHGGAYDVGARKMTLKMMVVDGGAPASGWDGEVVVLTRRVDEGHEEMSVVQAGALVKGEAPDPYLQEHDVAAVLPRAMVLRLNEGETQRVAIAAVTPVKWRSMVVSDEGKVGPSADVREQGSERAYLLRAGMTLRELLAQGSDTVDFRNGGLRIRLVRTATVEMTLGALLDGSVPDYLLQSGDEIVLGELPRPTTVDAPHAGEAGTIMIVMEGAGGMKTYELPAGKMTVTEVLRRVAKVTEEQMAGRTVMLVRGDIRKPRTKIAAMVDWDRVSAGLAADHYVQPEDMVVVRELEKAPAGTAP